MSGIKSGEMSTKKPSFRKCNSDVWCYVLRTAVPMNYSIWNDLASKGDKYSMWVHPMQFILTTDEENNKGGEEFLDTRKKVPRDRKRTRHCQVCQSTQYDLAPH